MDIGFDNANEFTVDELSILSDILAEHREQAKQFLTQDEWAELKTLQDKIDERIEDMY